MNTIRRTIVDVAFAHIERSGAPVYVEEYDRIVGKIRFNPPSDADHLEDKTYGVFLPEGGAVPYQTVPFLLMENRRAGEWVFNAEFDIRDYRMLTAEYKGKRIFNEIIAFLPGIMKKECEDIARMNGLTAVPQLESDQSDLYKKSMVKTERSDYEMPYTRGPQLDHPDLAGAGEGCFLSHDGKEYVFFNSLLNN